MITKSAMVSLALAMASASAQTSGNVTFSTNGPGITTMAFVAGELSGNTVKGQPYSAQAETQTTQMLADGNRIVNTSTASVYRDASGRERREQSMPGMGPSAAQGVPMQTVMISDPVAGINYSLNPADRVAMKMPMAQGMAGIRVQKQAIMATPTALAMPMLAPAQGPGPMLFARATASIAGDPPNVEQLGMQSIEGVQAQGTRTTFTIPAGQIGNDQPLRIVDESWRSPELQVIVQSTHSDPRMGTTTYTLRNISRSDPSPSLFQVPADYTIQETPAVMHSTPMRPINPPANQ